MSERVVFLTGATGFIGSRVARGLIAQGNRLRCLVRSPGSVPLCAMNRLPVTRSFRPSPFRSTRVEACPWDQAMAMFRRVHWPPSPCSAG